MCELATLSVSTLNQFALDFEGNRSRILESIRAAKRAGSTLRTGPELEIPGYSCQDHFYEGDTLTHSWEVVGELLVHPDTSDILVDVGLPIMHRGVTYNCRLIFLNRKILFIRPKMTLCDDGNYRESRWFTGWGKPRVLEPHPLPPFIAELMEGGGGGGGVREVPFGDGLLSLQDTIIGFDTCEELWSPASSHILQSLVGAEIILNGSGSYAELRKADTALTLVKGASGKCGGLYAFSNMRGGDGERVYFNGCSALALNGKVLGMGEQYSVKEVELTTASFYLDEIRCYRNMIRSRNLQASRVVEGGYPMVTVEWRIAREHQHLLGAAPTVPIHPSFCSPEEEIARGPALWLWDYLRRSTASGFFLPLSGGVDSAAVAIIVYSMCKILLEEEGGKRGRIGEEVRKVLKKEDEEDYWPEDARALCSQLLTTVYMGSENSSEETRGRAAALARAIGSNHSEIDISSTCSAFLEEAAKGLGGKPSFGGTRAENLALQNVQARSRMVFAYLFAQLGPWSKGKDGYLLVLGTANVDEAIRGYFTKYDCSAADLNPIGGISKTDLKSFIIHAGKKFGFPEIAEIVRAPPTAELTPLASNQTDEEDMGMSYEELGVYGKLRKPGACGPFSMFTRLLPLWGNRHSPSTIASKVKHFYTSYAANRHKMSVLTPACHMESYSPEDHRFDLRPLLYPIDFTWQFKKIDEVLRRLMP